MKLLKDGKKQVNNSSLTLFVLILQHHERLDGSGYTEGLKGEEICSNARIVMIADTADAITSCRPYKPTREMNEAIKILRSDEGKYHQELITLLEKILK
jgi:HD-GYP domain-containing protein (c-di-GMP phosphodiesterase class II)